MDIFNRIVVILAILVVMIAVPLALTLPEQAHLTLQYTADVVQANLAWLNGLAPSAQLWARIALAAAGLIVFCIALLLLVLEVIRLRKSTVRLKDGSGELVMDGVAGHLTYYVDLLPDVLRVRPTVQSTGGGVRTTLQVETAPGIHVPTKSREVKETARRVLEEQLGLRVKGDIKVVIKPVPYPRARRGRPVMPPIEPAPVVPPPEIEPAPVVPPPPIEPAPAPPPEPEAEPVAEEALWEETADSSETIDVKAPPEPDPEGLDATRDP